MGIAGNMFWIMAGILYLIYRGIKEEPETTIPVLIIVPLIVGGIAGYGFLSNWLIEQNIIVGAIFSFGTLGTGIFFLARSQYKERLRQQKWLDEYNEWMNKVRSSLTEQDYEEYARKNAYRYYANMNPSSCMYWKKEPYYSKIKSAVELQRSIEMHKEDG